MPLPNRVDPFGRLFASDARGTMLGNRGGRFHRADKTLAPTRRWASRQWICCALHFRDRHLEVWGQRYTQLFFLDEVTALAAGHRPCFECRRKAAQRFQGLFPQGPVPAPAMDVVLHAERLEGRAKRLHDATRDRLPDGVMVAEGDTAFAWRRKGWLRWTPQGYVRASPPRHIKLLTPPSIVAALRAGYPPQWHDTAGT